MKSSVLHPLSFFKKKKTNLKITPKKRRWNAEFQIQLNCKAFTTKYQWFKAKWSCSCPWTELLHFWLKKRETTGWINHIFRYKVFSFWRLSQLKSYSCDRQVYSWRTLLTRSPHFLPRCCPGESVCPVPQFLQGCVCTYGLYVSVFGHSQPITRGQVRLGLVPDSWKSGQLHNLRQTPQRETVKYTSRTHYLFFSHFFFLSFASSNIIDPPNLQTSNL